MSLKQRSRSGIDQLLGDQPSQSHRVGISERRAVVDAHGQAGLWRGYDGKDRAVPSPAGNSRRLNRAAMNADGNLAAATQSRQRRPLNGDGKAGGRIVEKSDCGNRRFIVFARLDAQ